MKTEQEKLFNQLDNTEKKELNELFYELENELGNKDKTEIFVNHTVKSSLIKARKKLDPEYDVEYPFYWKKLVINANWLDIRINNIVVIFKDSHYKTINPGNKPINY